MKKYLAAFGLMILVILSLSGLTFAADDPLKNVCAVDPASSVCDTPNSSKPIVGPDGVLTRVTSMLGIAAGIIAIIVLTVSGLQFILSSGDSQKVAKAKDGIIYALVGLAIVIVSRTIVMYALSKL